MHATQFRRITPPSVTPTRGKWRLFGVGLAVRLLGVALLWLGDGHSSLFSKALVVVGVILSIGGITVLRYLLLAGPLSRMFPRRSAGGDDTTAN